MLAIDGPAGHDGTKRRRQRLALKTLQLRLGIEKLEVAGAALEVDEQRAVGVLRVGDLAGEDRDLLAVRRGVVEGDRELVLGQAQAGDVVADGHSAL